MANQRGTTIAQGRLQATAQERGVFSARTASLATRADALELFSALKDPRHPDCALLESADIETRKTLQSILVTRAALRLECRGERVTVTALSPEGEVFLPELAQHLAKNSRPQADAKMLSFEFARSNAADEAQRLAARNPLEVLRVVNRLAAQLLPAPLGMLIGGFGYEFIDTYEELNPVQEGANTFPDYAFVLAQELILIDHESATASAHCFSVMEDEASNTDFIERFAAASKQLQNQELAQPLLRAENGKRHPVTASISDSEFAQIVEEMQQAIRCGDIYQVVPSRSFSTPCTDPLRAYRYLRAQNPSPYMFYLAGPDYVLFGSSPESYLKFDALTRKTELYPIAGTRARGFDEHGQIAPERDARLELSLRTDAKELAEHIMLVDLARNDMARIGAPGSRRVEKLLGVDRYSHVMHLVSRVTCTLDERFDALDAYRACMNMGTLTGAPKISATNLLRAVEQVRRGSYGGAVGYLGADGSFDSCIVIRSAFCARDMALVQAGAGVVRDSSPAAEADETFQKASAVLFAIAAAAGATQLEVAK